MTRAVERAAQILLALASGTPRLGVSEISEIVDVPKPTVHTMLANHPAAKELKLKRPLTVMVAGAAQVRSELSGAAD